VKRAERRERLRNRRAAISFDFSSQGLHFTCTSGKFDDGRLGKLFLQNNKTNSAAGILASDSAIAASLALQHGCESGTLRRAVQRDVNGVASGPLGVALDIIAKDDDRASN
jgi:hypothetical protein